MSYRIMTMLGLCCLGLFATAQEPSLRAVAEATEARGGLAVVIGHDDADLLIELAETGSWLVLGLVADEAAVSEQRERIAAAGMSGLASVVRWEAGDPIPLRQRMANLVIADLDALGGRARAAREEIERVLVPLGHAYWREGSNWTTHEQPRPDSLGTWTHLDHDPGATSTSRDTEVGPGTNVQWIAGPHTERDGPISSPRVNATRLIYEWDLNDEDHHLGGRNHFVCRDAFNGIVLWQTPTPDQRRALQARAMVIDENHAYMIVGEDEARVQAVDLATGDVAQVYDFGLDLSYDRENQGDCWLLLTGDRLVLANQSGIACVDKNDGQLMWRNPTPSNQRYHYPALAESAGLVVVAQGVADRHPNYGRVVHSWTESIIAFDMENGEERWQATEGMPRFLSRLIIRDDRLLLFGAANFSGFKDDGPDGEGRYFIAGFDVTDGRALWHHTRQLWREHLRESISLRSCYFRSDGVWLTNAHYQIRLHPDTGEVLDVWSGMGDSFGARCSRSTATDQLVLTGSLTYVDDAYRTRLVEISRSACATGPIPANGLVYTSANRCRCFRQIRSWLAMAPGEAPEPDFDDTLLEGTDAPADPEWNETVVWPTDRYQVTSARVGGDAPEPRWLSEPLVARPAGPVADDWRLAPGRSGQLTFLAVADDQVFITDVDAGRVLALDTDRGRERWRFQAGGRIDGPVKPARGMVVFGCQDGHVYALDAQTGELAWRNRVAPNERYTVAYSQLESLWPVYAEVAVTEGQVWASAGRHPEADGGIYLAAFDLESGEATWRSRYHADRPWGPDEDGDPRRADLTNQVVNEPTRLADGWVVSGRIVIDPRTRAAVVVQHTRRAEEQVFDIAGQPTDAQREAALAFAPSLPGTGGRPRWYTLALQAEAMRHQVYGDAVVIDTERHRAYAAAWRGGRGRGRSNRDLDAFALDGTSPIDHDADPLWSVEYPRDRDLRYRRDSRTLAMVLASEHLVLVRGHDLENQRHHRNRELVERLPAWLEIRSTSDGTVFCQVPLPAEPNPQGLAVVNGRIYVSLRDGRVAAYDATP